MSVTKHKRSLIYIKHKRLKLASYKHLVNNILSKIILLLNFKQYKFALYV